jgi:hypothetical protein
MKFIPKDRYVMVYPNTDALVLVNINKFLDRVKQDDPDFYIEKLPKNTISNLASTQKWNSSCGAPLERLVLINVKFYEKKNLVNKSGKLIVLDSVSENMIKVFKKLYSKKIIIDKIKTIEHYDNHESSYMDGNSGSFVCDSRIKNLYPSLNYDYGTAIDLNPFLNPKIEFVVLENKQNSGEIKKTLLMKADLENAKFLNRSFIDSRKNENFIKIFSQNGFTEWGGTFGLKEKITVFNYFGVNEIVSKLLVLMQQDDAKKFFKIIVKNHKIINKIDEEEFFLQFKLFYQKNPQKFLLILEKNIGKLKTMESGEFFNLFRTKFE